VATVLPLPRVGAVLEDARAGGRALRVSWHPEQDIMVLSVWRGKLCTASFQLDAVDVPALVGALVGALVQPDRRSSPRGADVG